MYPSKLVIVGRALKTLLVVGIFFYVSGPVNANILWDKLLNSDTQSVFKRLEHFPKIQCPTYDNEFSERCYSGLVENVIPEVAIVCSQCRRIYGSWKFDYCCRCSELVFGHCYEAVVGHSLAEVYN
jgi:hypothetical protein